MTAETNKQAYERDIELLNAQDFGSLHEVVDPERYREICVGFTPGWVNLPEAEASLKKVVGGIPDLNARIDDLVGEDDRVYARLTVTGTNTGRFFGAPPTGCTREPPKREPWQRSSSGLRPYSPSVDGGSGP